MINPKSFALFGLLLLFLLGPEALGQPNGVYLESTHTCAAPDSINLLRRSCDSLVFTQPNSSDTLIVEYGPQGFVRGMGTVVTLYQTPYRFGNLSPGLSYEFHFQKLCGTDTSSVFGYADTSSSGPLPIAIFTKDSTIHSALWTDFYFDATGSQHAVDYFWDFFNGQTSTKPIDTVTYLGAGTYRVSLAVSNPCGMDSDTVNIYPQGFIGISLNENPMAQIQVYPNPSSKGLRVEGKLGTSMPVHIQISDIQGRVLLKRTVTEHNAYLKQRFDVAHLASGLYTIKVSQGSEQMSRSIIINH